jgi:hypothetical protein
VPRNDAKRRQDGLILDCFVPRNDAKRQQDGLILDCFVPRNDAKRRQDGSILDCFVPRNDAKRRQGNTKKPPPKERFFPFNPRMDYFTITTRCTLLRPLLS